MKINPSQFAQKILVRAATYRNLKAGNVPFVCREMIKIEIERREYLRDLGYYNPEKYPDLANLHYFM